KWTKPTRGDHFGTTDLKNVSRKGAKAQRMMQKMSNQMICRALLAACPAPLRLCVSFLLFAIAVSGHAADRPNILLLIAEGFIPDLGCYGMTEVSTPNLDRLAGQGVRYTRFFTTAPVCSASRSAFMTGMYQTTIGAHNHRSHRDDGYHLPEGVRVLPDWLRDAGYYTANLVELPPEFGFKGTGKTDWNFTYEGKRFDGEKWADLKAHQ